MATPKRIKGVSSVTKQLLGEGETTRADFKRASDGISADDFVAFANSEQGGTILAGVDEIAGAGGAQVGAVVGCDVSDGAVLQLTNKALSCLPPVAIDVRIENLDDKPILRIDIASSPTKPHCTPKGVYCRRDGTRNRALHPSELLALFLDSEARAFAQRFEAAAERITEELGSLEQGLERSIKSMGDQLGWADYQLGNTESTLDSVLAYVTRINTETNDQSARLRTLFRQDKRQDPVHDREREKLRGELVEQLMKDRTLLKGLRDGRGLSVSANGKAAEELTKDDLSAIFDEAIKIVIRKLEDEKYSVDIKRAGECTELELEAVAALIREGGEVAANIEARLPTADRIGIVRYEKTIVGTASLKKPTADYRKRVFAKAETNASHAEFSRELGWIYLRPDYPSAENPGEKLVLFLRASTKA